MTKRNKQAEALATAIIAELEKGVYQWRKTWKAVFAQTPLNGKSKRGYKGYNYTALAYAMQSSGYQDPRFYTFKQVQELGGKVNKGEHGTSVEHWLWFDKEIAKLEGRCPFKVSYYTVFNAEQCSGLPEMPQPEPVHWNLDEEAERIIKNSGVPIIHSESDRAYYRAATDKIHVPPMHAFANAQDYYSTLLHELVHSTGHQSRCKRAITNKFGTASYAEEELIAEIGSLMLCTRLGIEPEAMPENHLAYVGNWLKVLKDDPCYIFRACAAAEKAVCFLLGEEAPQEEPESLN